MPNISDMPAPGPLTGLELIPVLQGGGSDGNVGLPLLVNNSAFGGAALALRVPMVADLSATAEADPGAAGVRWNNADPHSATELYISDADGNSGDLAALFATLATGGCVYLQGAADSDARDNLQRCQVTSVSVGTGYTKLAVTVQASGGTFADDDALELTIQQPKPAGEGGVQTIVAGAGVSVDSSDPANPVVSASGSSGLGWFDVAAYGAVGDGVTDDTAAIQAAITAAATAGGGTVYFPAAVYIAAGALQDTSRGNAQILLPAVSTPDDEPITIVLRGAFPPPPNVSVIGATPTPDGQSVIKGTLNTGTGAVIGGWGPSGSFNNNTRIHLIIQDLTVRTPANPVLTAVDLSHVATCQIDNLFIDTGSYYVQGLAEPTTATSYGLRLPRNGNGAQVKIGTVNVLGFYNGIQISEHANGGQVGAWGCKRAFEFIASDHASHFDRMMAHHCERVLVASGVHYVDIDQLNIEHAASGWWVTDYDIDDANNYLRGSLRWHVVLAGVGADSTFTVNGAQGVQVAKIGLPFVAAVVEKTASHVATILDAGKFVEMNVASANTFTIPPNSSVPFPKGTEIHVMQTGVGQTSLAAGSGVTISHPASQSWDLSEQYAAVTVKKVGTNAWRAMGLIG